MMPIGKDDWSWVEKGEGPVATRIDPSVIDGTNRSSSHSSSRRRDDGRACAGATRRALVEACHLMVFVSFCRNETPTWEGIGWSGQAASPGEVAPARGDMLCGMLPAVFLMITNRADTGETAGHCED